MHFAGSRWRAFSIHLLISLAIFIVLLAIICLWWYPGALFEIAGGWQGVRIVAAVDLVLGPLLTLVVYDMRKPVMELVRDLGVIALLQFSCLSAGVYVVYQARPLALVHVFDTFHVLNRASYLQAGLSSEELMRFKVFSPEYFYIDLPAEKTEFLELHVKGMLDGRPLQTQLERYKTLPVVAGQVERIMGRNAHSVGPGCIRLDIESAYETGTICFDKARRFFFDFRKSDAAT